MQNKVEGETVVVPTHRIDLRHLGLGIDFIEWPISTYDGGVEITNFLYPAESRKKIDGFMMGTFKKRIFED